VVTEDRSYKGGLLVDEWLRLEVAPAAVPMLLELRRRWSFISLTLVMLFAS